MQKAYTASLEYLLTTDSEFIKHWRTAMSSLPQCRIEQVGPTLFIIHREVDGVQQAVDKKFESHQQALDYILAQGWQVQRERPTDSMIIASRFLKP